MSEISGLVAVAWNGGDMGREWTTDKIVAESWVNNSKTQQAIPVVLLEDAEAIIAQKDAEILEQCRINGMGAEREATLLGKVERQSAALKLAREALFDMQDSYAAVHGWKDSFVIAATTALAAIDNALEGEAS